MSPSSMVRCRIHQWMSAMVVSPTVITASEKASSSQATVQAQRSLKTGISSGMCISRKSRITSSADTMRDEYFSPSVSSRKFRSVQVRPSAIGRVGETLRPIRCGSRSSITRRRCGRTPSSV